MCLLLHCLIRALGDCKQSLTVSRRTPTVSGKNKNLGLEGQGLFSTEGPLGVPST